MVTVVRLPNRRIAITENSIPLDRRLIPRHRRDLIRVEFLASNQQSYSGEIQDISVQGLGLVCAHKLDLGIRFEIQLPSTTWSRPNLLPAVVRHATAQPDGTWLLGASFTRNVTADDFLALRNESRDVCRYGSE